MKHGNLSLVTVFGLGSLRPFPGTWGSLPAVALSAALLWAGARPGGDGSWAWGPWLAYHGVMLGVMLVFGLSCLTRGDWAEARYGRKDPSNVVADELAGQCLALSFLPGSALSTPQLAAFTLAYSFVAFRAMDIVKPPPALRLQAVPGGLGILLDDVAAGAYALALVWLTSLLAP